MSYQNISEEIDSRLHDGFSKHETAIGVIAVIAAWSLAIAISFI